MRHTLAEQRSGARVASGPNEASCSASMAASSPGRSAWTMKLSNFMGMRLLSEGAASDG